ncbi:SHOCT domain-containing protein [Rhodococcus sp. G-MC3]|uniref:SHOCT domain-containing protein n=1 Tax=Rhodococcus sp. G-MC3 TaxID=3046209 RepID=UPI0024B95649|nr:SHOCT domain-containing protein [Rhodococcus sp. G-MC3]MDJ0395685.1 SHOCT domain-containing protein [Rhodococcus sp. G-MC3]
MYQELTPAGENAVKELAGKYGISTDAVRVMLDAVNAGRGSMAQFNIPELGGGGQWMRGGMTMVGNMFDYSLKGRVDGLCRDLSGVLAQHQVYPPAQSQSESGSSSGGSWWPSDLGSPSSSGGQNGSQYAYFPGSRRLAVLAGGRLSVYDTLDHSIGGVQQQQGGGPGSLEFTSQYGTFTAASLPLVDPVQAQSPAPPQPFAPQQETPPPAAFQPAAQSNQATPMDLAEVTSAIEALASLHGKGILTDDEFFTKKAELLKRI